LPEPVQVDSLQKSYNNGILEIRLRKAQHGT
jgi:HSP20 family molecular chaperone IbpA